MDADKLIRLINGVGFPVVMCLALYYTNTYLMSQQLELLQEFKEAMQLNIIETKQRTDRAEYIIRRIEQIDAKLNLMECKP